VGPVKTALKDLGRATFPTATVLTTFGNRVTVTGAGGRLTIGNALGDALPESLGPHRTMENNYDVVCKLSSTINGTIDDQERCTLRALTWFDDFETAVRSVTGQNLGVTGVIWAGWMGEWELTEADAQDTKGEVNTVIEFKIHVRSRSNLT
jgi:hypothetical protein